MCFIMSEILKVTEQASTQLKKLFYLLHQIQLVLLVGIDKAGCNGYSYKLDFAKKAEVENLEYVEQQC